MVAESKKPTVIDALLAVMADVTKVGKDGFNTQQKYKFRGIDGVVNEVGPAFRTHGVIAVPVKTNANYRDVLTSTGKPSRECTVTVTYRFYGPAGDHIDAEVPGESMDTGDKGTPKAMSVAFRTALLQALCIPTGDPDPDLVSYERAQEQPPSEKSKELFKAVTETKTQEALQAVWVEVQEAYTADAITEREAGQLRQHVLNQKNDLEKSA